MARASRGPVLSRVAFCRPTRFGRHKAQAVGSKEVGVVAKATGDAGEATEAVRLSMRHQRRMVAGGMATVDLGGAQHENSRPKLWFAGLQGNFVYLFTTGTWVAIF